MNRRNFLSAMLKAGVGCLILPGAGRVWKRNEFLYIPNDPFFDRDLYNKLAYYVAKNLYETKTFASWTHLVKPRTFQPHQRQYLSRLQVTEKHNRDERHTND